MTDTEIINLFFERSEQAIEELAKKHGNAVARVARNILGNAQDAEECVNDTYLGTWNTIPPNKPNPLRTFVCKIARNLATKKYHSITAEKRNSQYDLALDELEEYLSDNDSVEEAFADYEAETIKVIRGQSKFSAELLTSLSAKAKDELEELKTALEAAQEELDALRADETIESEEYDRLIGWADVYDRCSFETKKMFVSKFIKAVRVFRDYRLEIDFNVSYEEFRNLTVQTAV